MIIVFFTFHPDPDFFYHCWVFFAHSSETSRNTFRHPTTLANTGQLLLRINALSWSRMAKAMHCRSAGRWRECTERVAFSDSGLRCRRRLLLLRPRAAAGAVLLQKITIHMNSIADVNHNGRPAFSRASNNPDSTVTILRSDGSLMTVQTGSQDNLSIEAPSSA